jgi:hypothetical protein
MFLLLLFTFLEDMLTNAQPPCDYRLLLSIDGDLPTMPIAVRTDVDADALVLEVGLGLIKTKHRVKL